jgi:hypothetical protein
MKSLVEQDFHISTRSLVDGFKKGSIASPPKFRLFLSKIVGFAGGSQRKVSVEIVEKL